MRIGINGFGRMGRLALRAATERFPALEVVAINEPAAGADELALLLAFDSVHGRWNVECVGDGGRLRVGGRSLELRSERDPARLDWGDLGVELVLECSGALRTRAKLEPHFERGARRVIVSAPVKDGAPDVVLGVNEDQVDLGGERLLTAASCTTNCLAPLVSVLHRGIPGAERIGIERGLVTTIHAPTNTQVVVDAPKGDPRRARATLGNLIPTSTNSAYAVTRILPELEGRLDSIAVRAPVQSASIVDAVLQVARDTDSAEVNRLLETASNSQRLRGILGFESRPLVSSDFRTDPRSGVVDGPSTRVTDRRLVKVLAWYDNEWGYANRLVELAALVREASGRDPA